jgi:hypothetical protein
MGGSSVRLVWICSISTSRQDVVNAELCRIDANFEDAAQFLHEK